MARVLKGEINIDEEKYDLTCILDRDIKINVYKSTSFSQLLQMNVGNNLMQGELLESYVSYIEKDTDSKSFKRRTYTHGDIRIANVVLMHTTHSFMENEEIHSEVIQGINGFEEEVIYEKETGAYKIRQREILENGVRQEVDISVKHREGQTIHISLRDIGSGRVTKTKDIDYRESLFDIGQVRENAIHTQVRSLQHLRRMKDLSWIDELIEKDNMRVIFTEEELENLIEEIKTDFKNTGEKKIYYDTEGTGLNVMDLPPDHPKKDMMAAHVIAWVKEREKNGYPKNVVSVVIPVGMKYVKSLDEIWVKDKLKEILCNPNIGVVAHNSDYELQINARYSEIEGELSYNEYYKWLKNIKSGVEVVDIDTYKDQINDLRKKIKQIEENKNILSIMKAGQIKPLEAKIKELKSKIDYKNEIERVRNLPKEEKPYLSKIKGEDIYRINIKYDTLVLSRMVNNGAEDSNGVPFFRHNLEFLTNNYLGYEQLSLDDIYGNAASSQHKIYDFSLLPEEYLYYYACPDGWTLPYVEWHLENAVYNHMIDLGYNHERAYMSNLEMLNLYYKIDVPFARHQALYANYKGIAIDKEKLDKERIEQEQIRDSIEELMADLTGEDISWTSVKQVGSLVFHKYKYPVKYRTEKHNEPSYNKATRRLHVTQTKDKHDEEYKECVPLAEMEEDLVVGNEVIIKKDIINNLMCPLSYLYQEFMDRHKDLTSFTQMIYDRTFEVNGEWIYYPSYISTSTDTGRASGGIMIMKHEKKDMFIARENNVLIGGDLDQAELRLIATMAGDLEEINRFKDPRYDPHTQTASDVNSVEVEEVTGEMRDAAKVINFGIAYGIGAKAATRNIYPHLIPTPEHLISKTAVMIKEYNRTYIVKSSWLDNLKQSTVKYGYSKTPYGRYKFFPDIKRDDLEQWEMGRIGRQGGNVPIQGLCADFIKQRIVWLFNEIENANITRYFTQPLFVHDEFFMEVNKKAFKNAENKVYNTDIIKEEQQFNILWLYEQLHTKFTEIPLDIQGLEDEAPMTMGVGVGESWLAAKSDLYGCPHELQEDLVIKYRQNNIDDELFKGLCKDPINVMLDEIRTWWANEIKKELDKKEVDYNNLPNNLTEYVDDLFLRRNLKDIFFITPDELEEMGLERDNYFTGQCIKALRFLKGGEVKLKEVLNQDKEEGIFDIVYSEQPSIANDLLDLETIDKVKDYYRFLEGELITEFDRENIEKAYASVFKESSMMEYNRFMAYEETRTFEFNVRYLLREYIVKLEKLIRKYDGLGIYNVVIIKREDGQLFGEVIETTYRVPLNIQFLTEIKALYNENKQRKMELERGLTQNIGRSL